MSEINIFFNPLNADSLQKYEVAAGTLLIDFLQEHFPIGFNGALLTFVGTMPLAVEDLDYEVKDEESITMLIMPAGPPAAAATPTLGTVIAEALISAAVAAAVATVVSLTISFLFGPDPDIDQGQESPVYSINPTRNQFRLGEPISAHYGTVSYPPDYASTPYGFNAEESNDQFVDLLLCLGHGDFTLDEIYVGDTPVSAFEAGTVQYWLYGPSDHNSTFGVIEADILSKVTGSSTPYPFWENVFTSPEVESFVFSDDVNDVVSAPVAITGGNAFASTVDPATGNYTLGKIVGITDTVTISEGDVLTLTSTLNNNGDLVVGAVTNNGDGTLTVFERWTDIGRIAQENPLNGQFTVNTSVSQMLAGPYRAQRVGQQVNEVSCDIIFPNGVMDIDADGDQNYKLIEMAFNFQQIDETTGAPIGGPVTVNRSYRYKQRRPVRSTVSSGPLTPGAYEVTVERITPFASAGRDIEETVWTTLKGHVVLDTSQEAYGPVTLMAVRLKASNALGSAARSRLRVTATRTLAGDSSNPITVFKDIWTDTNYGMGRTQEEYDQNALNALEVLYAEPGGPKFNGSFDQKGTGWEALEQVMSLCGAKVVQQNALTTVIQDQTQAVRRAMFSTANIIPDSLEIIYSFDPDGDFDGITVEYRDPTTFDPLFLTYPATAVNPEKINLFGCTDEIYAGQFAVYLWQVKSQRRKIVSFLTELEGLIPVFGDRIGVSHSMPDWGQSGVIVQRLNDRTFRVDQPLDWDRGSFIILRDATGSPTQPVFVTMGNTEDIVVFSAAPPINVFAASTREPTMYSFGTQYTVLKDFVVTKIDPQSETRIKITGQLYDVTVYNGAPPHMGG